MSSPPTKKAKTEQPSTNNNINQNNIPAPTSKGWGKSEWEKWSTQESAKYDCLHKEDNQGLISNWEELDEYIDKRHEAVQSAAPDEITVKIYIEEVIDHRNNAAAAAASAEAGTSTTTCNKKVSEIVIYKQGSDTFRSILDRYCQEQNIERDDYHWSHKHKVYPGDGYLLNRTDVECFFQFWHVHPPTLIKRFVDENTFMPEVVGRLKRSPASKPSVAPPFDKLKCLPPDGNACKEDWDKWRRQNSMGCVQFWMQRGKAIEYAAPDEIEVQLKGLSHEHTVKVNTDDPLCIALASYCASTSGTLAVTSSDVILREYGNEPKFIDAQTTSARMSFHGYSPLKFEVVYRDTSRTEREIESIQGIIPEGYQQFLGAGYVRGFVFDVSFCSF